MKNKFSQLDFQNDIMKKTSNALKKLEESKHTIKPLVGNSSYKELLIENKMINDMNFLNYLGKKYLNESSEDYQAFFYVITESISLFNKLHMEVDIKPSFISPALNYNKALSEVTKIDIYKKYLEENLIKNFSQPLLEGKLFLKYEKGTKLLLESTINAEILDIDIKKFTKYAIFESVLFKAISDIIIPNYTKKEINTFVSKQVPEYFEMFQENALYLNNQLEENIKKITIVLGPKIFNEACNIQEEDIQIEDLSNDNAISVGPIGEGKVTKVECKDSGIITNFQPDLNKTSENILGLENDLDLDENGDPKKDPNLEKVVDESGLQDIDSDISYTEDEINTSTNDGIITDAPPLEIGEPYLPADKLPEDTTINFNSIIDDLESERSIDNLKSIQLEPEEYISIPVDASYQEENTTLSKKEKFNYRQFAGAMNIILKN